MILTLRLNLGIFMGSMKDALFTTQIKISLRDQAAMSHHSVGSRVRWIKMDEGGCDSFDKIQLSPVADNPHLIH